jgi:hypothetical protein
MFECSREFGKAWLSENTNEDRLLFDYPKGVIENYTCLFLEIILGLMKEDDKYSQDRGLCFWEMLESELSKESAKIYRELCYLSEIKESMRQVGKNSQKDHEISPHELEDRTEGNALICRHWYSTLACEMDSAHNAARKALRVRTLPGDISISGEWYLAIPYYSAAPEVGMSIIQRMTSPEAELNRLQIGVGMPTRETFYNIRLHSDAKQQRLIPGLKCEGMQIRETLRGAFRRSSFRCYAKVANMVGEHLKNMIVSEESVDNSLETIKAQMMYILNSEICGECKGCNLGPFSKSKNNMSH